MQGDAGASLAKIAEAAGVSRQAVYLAFSDRTGLFIALARHIDDARGLPAALSQVENAATGMEALEAFVELQATKNADLRPIIETFELLRRQDPAAEAAWQDRLNNRLATSRRIAERLNQERQLRDGLSVEAAADLIWTLTSFRMWSDLVVERGWTPDAYRSEVLAILHCAIGKPNAP